MRTLNGTLPERLAIVCNASGGMTDYVLTGPTKRRAEIADEIGATPKGAGKLSADLMTIVGLICLVATDGDIGGIRPKIYRPPADWSKRGEMRRATLDLLRVARAPMPSREIEAEIIIRRGFVADTAMFSFMSKRYNSSLGHASKGGHVRSREGGARFWLLWKIVR